MNVLNEVCHEINILDFEEIIGVQKKIFEDWVNKISKREKKEEIILLLDNFELNFLQKSFEEVFKQIDEWEFQTRVGVTKQEAIIIQEKIGISKKP